MNTLQTKTDLPHMNRVTGPEALLPRSLRYKGSFGIYECSHLKRYLRKLEYARKKGTKTVEPTGVFQVKGLWKKSFLDLEIVFVVS